MRLRKPLAVLLSGAFLLATVGPVAADPSSNTQFQAGTTPIVVMSQINRMGDEAFSKNDLENEMGDQEHAQHYGPYASSSTDSGTCGPDWANDTFDRHFFVKNNRNGTYTVVEQFREAQFTSFVTPVGPSPGGCDTDPGGTILPGKSGAFFGYEVITVTGTQISTSQTCQPGPCTTGGFMATHFAGPFTVGTFFFVYGARDQGLAFHFWRNASCDRGGNLGDIASTAGPTGLQHTRFCP